MKKILLVMIILSVKGRASQIDLHADLVQTKVEQDMAYVGVKQALGEDFQLSKIEDSMKQNSQQLALQENIKIKILLRNK